MSHPDWFSPEHLPTGRLRVRVKCDGGTYQLLAACDVDKKGRRHWHELVGREVKPLSRAICAWQPEDASRWRWPNGIAPEPLPIQVTARLAMIGDMAFDAVLAAEEMDGDRVAARATPDEPDDEKVQWWRDVASVAYQPMGAVSLEMGEARIMRWLIANQAIPDDFKRYRTNAAVLAALKMTLADLIRENPGADWVPRLALQPEDWRDFEVVASWFTEAPPNKREWKVLRGRMLAPPATWVELADYLHFPSYQRAQQLYQGVIEKLVKAANRPAERAPASLAKLQERNRKARRRG